MAFWTGQKRSQGIILKTNKYKQKQIQLHIQHATRNYQIIPPLDLGNFLPKSAISLVPFFLKPFSNWPSFRGYLFRVLSTIIFQTFSIKFWSELWASQFIIATLSAAKKRFLAWCQRLFLQKKSQLWANDRFCTYKNWSIARTLMKV